MQGYIYFIGYCIIVAVLVAILWQWVFAPYKKYREEQLIKFTELVQQGVQEGEQESPGSDELINEKI